MHVPIPVHLFSVQDMSCVFDHALHLAQEGKVAVTDGGEVVAWLISAERYADLVAQCNLMHGQLSLLRPLGAASEATCEVPAAPSAG